MKRLLFIIIFIFIQSITGFSAESANTGNENNQVKKQPEAVPVTQKQKDKELYGVGDVKIDLGLNIGGGISFNTTRISTEGDRIFMFAGQVSFRAIFHFSYFSGMIFDAGVEYLSMKEKQDTYTPEYRLLYGYIAASYLMLYKRLCIYFGPFIEFTILGKYEKIENDVIDDHSSFTFPNVGFNFGAGAFVLRSKSFKLYVGFSMKYQFLSCMRVAGSGSKILAFFLDVSMFF